MKKHLRHDLYPNPQNVHDLSVHKDFDKGIQQHKLKKAHIKTLEMSTQVNMSEEFPEAEEQKRRKREKKKEYKRRKRQRERDEEKQAQDILAEIISRIYKGETSFSQSKTEIQYCLQWLVSGEKFHTFLNQIIRIHVKNIQNEMWKFMQESIHSNPFEKSDEDQEFYLLMIDRIYNQFRKLQVSSKEIEEIINLYMRLKQNQQKIEHYNLDKSTFCYFIQSDQTIKVLLKQLKNLIKICERRLSSQHQKQMKELNLICEMINEDDEDEEYSQDDDPEWETEQSTSVDEEEQSQERNNRRKKRKHKKAEFSLNILDVVKRIRETVIARQNQIKSMMTEQRAQRMLKKLRQEQGY